MGGKDWDNRLDHYLEPTELRDRGALCSTGEHERTPLCATLEGMVSLSGGVKLDPLCELADARTGIANRSHLDDSALGFRQSGTRV
jgi:hypothetical protein